MVSDELRQADSGTEPVPHGHNAVAIRVTGISTLPVLTQGSGLDSSTDYPLTRVTSVSRAAHKSGGSPR